MYYLISINIISFVLMFIDKRKAIHNKWRIPEGTLLLTSIIGGYIGLIIGMNLFKHKTRKLKFKIIPILSLVCHLFIIQIIYY